MKLINRCQSLIVFCIDSNKYIEPIKFPNFSSDTSKPNNIQQSIKEEDSSIRPLPKVCHNSPISTIKKQSMHISS